MALEQDWQRRFETGESLHVLWPNFEDEVTQSYVNQAMEPKLIPIVTTATEVDAVELVQTYTRRWPAQENAIRDWLIPLGIDINHGYAKTVVVNSEVTKKPETLQKRLENVRRWTDGARKRMRNASKLYQKRCQQTKKRADALYRDLNNHQREMERQGVEHWLLKKTIKEEKARADAEIEEYQQRQWKAYHTSNKEFARVREVLSRAAGVTPSY